MKIKAPVNCFNAAKIQIRFGAKQIFLGLKDENMCNLSFTGRGNHNIEGKGISSNILSYDELVTIVQYAHDHGVSVHFACNAPSLPDKLEDMFLRQVEKGVEAGVDVLILGDLASIQVVKRNGIDLPISASVFMEIFNIGMLKLLQKMKVDECIISHHLLSEEIEELSQLDIDISVFGNYSCSFNNGRCSLIHRWGETLDIGIPCRAKYSVTKNDTLLEDEFTFLDAGEDCCICALPHLMKLDIKSIKLIDRSTPVEQSAPFTKVYAKAIKMFNAGATVEEVKQMAFKVVPWWNDQFCQHQRCRYINTWRQKAYM